MSQSKKTPPKKTPHTSIQPSAPRVIRSFSQELKRKIVAEIEQGKLTPTEVSRCYQVRRSNVYRWIARFGSSSTPTERLVLECESDTQKALALQVRVAELERALGQKQLELEISQRIIAVAEEQLGVDFKKNCALGSSTPSPRIGKRTNKPRESGR
jgi:transposase